MKILLISPNTLQVPYPVYPIGLDYVAASVSPTHEVRIVDMNIETYESLNGVIKEFTPDIIGISCRNIDNTEAGKPLFCINEYRDIIRWLRKCSPAIIVCGGSGFTILPGPVFKQLGADYGVIGEGERFALLVDAISNGKDPEGIPGVMSEPGHANIPHPWTGEIHRGISKNHAQHLFYQKNGGMLNLQTKRGCTFKCIYCPYPHIEGARHRLIKPDIVAKNALMLQESGAKYLFITDSAFNSDIAHSIAVAKAFKKAGISIPWGGFFAPVKPPEDYFNLMADAGLTHIEFGTESFSDKMLKSYRKPFRSRDVFMAHREALQAGLHIAHYLLLGGPGESAETVNDCLQKVEQVAGAAFFFFTGIRIYPHTKLYDIALSERQITADMDLLEPVFYEADAIKHSEIDRMVKEQGGDRINWIIGSGGDKSAKIISRMHQKGYVGPLWDYLIRS